MNAECFRIKKQLIISPLQLPFSEIDKLWVTTKTKGLGEKSIKKAMN